MRLRLLGRRTHSAVSGTRVQAHRGGRAASSQAESPPDIHGFYLQNKAVYSRKLHQHIDHKLSAESWIWRHRCYSLTPGYFSSFEYRCLLYTYTYIYIKQTFPELTAADFDWNSLWKVIGDINVFFFNNFWKASMLYSVSSFTWYRPVLDIIVFFFCFVLSIFTIKRNYLCCLLMCSQSHSSGVESPHRCDSTLLGRIVAYIWNAWEQRLDYYLT